MSELPEINFKDKRQKKKGFLPWIRTRLGVGGPSAMGGVEHGLSGLGRASLGARFGASAAGNGGLSGLLAGKSALILGAAVVTAAVGTAVFMQSPQPQLTSVSSFNTNRTASNDYVPAVMRQKANQNSALDMLAETNKGIVSMDELPPKEEAPVEEKNVAPAHTAPPQDTAQAMAGKLVAAMGEGLSTSMGGGNGKMSGMGGFGNKFNKGKIGGKSFGMGEVGTSFPTSSAFDQRRKILAMKASSRPVFSKAAGIGKGAVGKGAYRQAKGVKAAQRSYIGTSADIARGTQDRAWAGSGTGETSSDNPGIEEGGGQGVVTSPSLDNVSKVGIDGPADEPVTDVAGATDTSPWRGLPQQAMMLLMMSSVMSIIGAKVIQISKSLPSPWSGIVYAIGISICVSALGMAASAMAIGVKLMSTYNQKMLGSIYTLGGGVASSAAVLAMTGKSLGPITPTWMAAIAGIIGMLGSMLGGGVISTKNVGDNGQDAGQKDSRPKSATTSSIAAPASVASSAVLEKYRWLHYDEG